MYLLCKKYGDATKLCFLKVSKQSVSAKLIARCVNRVVFWNPTVPSRKALRACYKFSRHDSNNIIGIELTEPWIADVVLPHKPANWKLQLLDVQGIYVKTWITVRWGSTFKTFRGKKLHMRGNQKLNRLLINFVSQKQNRTMNRIIVFVPCIVKSRSADDNLAVRT